MSKSSLRAFVAASLLVGSSSFGKITPDVLMYRHYAHQARDVRGLAERDETKSSIRVKQAIYKYDVTRRLFEKNAAAAFDLSDRILELAHARIDEAKTWASIMNAVAMEKIWKMRAEAAERGGDPTRQIAELMIDTRVQAEKAAAIAVTNIKEISREVNFQHTQSKKLLASNAISREEYFMIQTTSDELGTFIPQAEAELAAVRASVVEAHADLDTVLNQEKAP